MITERHKTNWAIIVTSENFVAYRNTLSALGYPIFSVTAKAETLADGGYDRGPAVLYWDVDNVIRRGGRSLPSGTEVYASIEGFLKWHWQQMLTPEQKEILELEEVISKAQEKITAIKQRANLK